MGEFPPVEKQRDHLSVLVMYRVARSHNVYVGGWVGGMVDHFRFSAGHLRFSGSCPKLSDRIKSCQVMPCARIYCMTCYDMP